MTSLDDQPSWRAQYDALVRRAGLVGLGHRTQIELTGADRAAWLHNLCTNEVRKLAVGAGCEAFLTSVQGKTLAHVFIFCQHESLVIDSVAGQGERILGHLDHYLISERVTLADQSQARSELFLGGPAAEPLLATITGLRPNEARLANAPASVAERAVSIRRADLAGPHGFLISAASEDVDAVRAVLLAAGAADVSHEAFEAARIEWGFPMFGRDITDSNLPQEVGRDALAISFVKGCYLGQETVARIDALGHVNKMLCGLRFDGSQIPEAGAPLSAEGQTAGHVTSAAFSPESMAPVALGYVRRGHNAPGSRLEVPGGAAEVIALPGARG